MQRRVDFHSGVAPLCLQLKAGPALTSVPSPATSRAALVFVFGSSKELSCLFTRTNGKAERYSGSINKYRVDIGFTKKAQMVWLVFAPGNIAPGAGRIGWRRDGVGHGR